MANNPASDAPKPDGRKTSKNMGRPLGARDKFPRQRASVLRGGLEERYRMLETELGRAYARIADLEALLNVGRPFDGDSKALLRAVYRGEYTATPQQIYAARAVLDREWPPVKSPEELDMQRAAIDQEREAVEQERITYRDGDATLESLIADFRKFTADRDDELTALVDAGEVTPAAAKAIRSWFIKEERLALPPPAGAPHAQDDAPATDPPTPTPSTRPRPAPTLPARPCPGASHPSSRPRSSGSSSQTEHSSSSRPPPAVGSNRTPPARSNWTAPIQMM